MIVIVLNGPINAGKTTTGKALAAMLPGARFIDGDDHGAPEDAPFLTILEMAFSRLERLILAASEPFLVIAIPLRDEDHARLRAAAESRGGRLLVATLAPPVELAVTNRGTRELKAGEVARSREMFAEGYASRAFSDVVISDMQGPGHTARLIATRLGLGV